MKYVFENLQEIEKRVKNTDGISLLLDFDGVLSAIAPTDKKAFISNENLTLLEKCIEQFPVAIVTGRTFSSIKQKVDVKNAFYIASHGLEWEENGKYHTKPVPQNILEAINRAKEKIKPLIKRYPETILEDKSLMFAVHYRMMNPELIDAFIKETENILKPFAEENKLRLDHHLMTFELRPEIDWDKGDSAFFAEEYFNKKTGKKLMPIYIGDSLTDEDAFTVLEKTGITIRVEESKTSVAEWYLKDQKEVSTFLKWLLSLKLI